MDNTFFSKFPLIRYNGSQIRDISSRVAIQNSVFKNGMVFYPHDISNGERPDQLSSRYYDDPYFSWVLFLSNEIVDPYYEWYLNYYDFNRFIVDKYGSIEAAIKKILFYRNNWYVNQDDTLSTAAHGALTPAQMKYWRPILNQAGNPSYYMRLQEDWKATTNQVLSIEVDGDHTFQVDETVDIKYNANSIGNGTVVQTVENKIIIQHISGDAFPNDDDVVITANSYMYGETSGSNNIIDTCTTELVNISADEFVYWTPITAYDYETERNEFNKTIRIFDKTYLPQLATEVKRLLRE